MLKQSMSVGLFYEILQISITIQKNLAWKNPILNITDAKLQWTFEYQNYLKTDLFTYGNQMAMLWPWTTLEEDYILTWC
jgi:hypothetical protein